MPEKRRGVTYSRSFSGTGVPSTERFQARPSGRAFERRPWSSKFARFEKDSSRSYANCVFVKGYLVIVFFPNAGSLSEAARVGKTEFFGEQHLTKGQIENRGWVGCD